MAMSADCSVGSNPLARLDKHTQQNRTLQHGSVASTRQSNPQQQFKSVQHSVTDANRFRMHNFMNGTTANSNMHFQQGAIPPLLQHSNSNTSAAWSKQFSPSPETVNASPMNGAWSQEFKSGTPTTKQHTSTAGVSTSHSNHIHHHQSHMVSGYRPGISMLRTNNAMVRQQPKYEQQSNMNQESWDEQFKELEREVSENLNLEDKETASKESENMGQDVDEIMVDDRYHADFQEVWDNLHDEATNKDTSTGLEQDWETDYARYLSGRSAHVAEYKYDTDNQYLHNPNAYEIGCILMENGAKLSEAALAFEAAVQENSQHVDAWLKLGLVQTQNEKELSGISALEQCLKIDPSNLQAMMTLAISYINEGYDVSAFSMLSKWIETKYPDIVTAPNVKVEEDRFNLNKAVTQHFLQIANQLSTVDPDVQLGLGILFYANEDYDKTIDCFKAALTVKPDDELMWNRLGASLANSNRSEEAIQAYHRALQLKPSFVRARYNLAVSSMNIGCYKEAAEYLLTALSMHEVEGVPVASGGSIPSTNILETLKRAFIAMERRDLLEKVQPGMDLQQFRSEFNF